MTIEQVGRAIWQRTKHLNPETISRWESDLAALGVSPEDARSVFVKGGRVVAAERMLQRTIMDVPGRVETQRPRPLASGTSTPRK